VVESGSGGQEPITGTWQRLEALPDPHSPQGRIYPLACLIAIGNKPASFLAVGGIRRQFPGYKGCRPSWNAKRQNQTLCAAT
jgi:hypothetical protein